jgi:hypothetical protein
MIGTSTLWTTRWVRVSLPATCLRQSQVSCFTQRRTSVPGYRSEARLLGIRLTPPISLARYISYAFRPTRELEELQVGCVRPRCRR